MWPECMCVSLAICLRRPLKFDDVSQSGRNVWKFYFRLVVAL